MSNVQQANETDDEKYYFKPENEPFPSKVMVACQGIEGAYSQITAKRLFPEGTFLYFKNFGAVIKAVREGMCDFGVLPIENNTFGSVKAVYQLLGKEEVNIVRGFRLKIEHQLLAKPGTKLKEITNVYSHEQALGQCAEFLRSLGDKVAETPCRNTAVAARMVAESSDPTVACLSSPECAKLYGLEVLKWKAADNDTNYTRFLCIARRKDIYPGANRISMIMTLPHHPGALCDILMKFKEQKINLLKLESEPIPGQDFEFRFYLDIEASMRDEAVRRMMREIKDSCTSFSFLGNYEELTE